MQTASDALLGWVASEGIDERQRHFYVRQSGTADRGEIPAAVGDQKA